MGTNCCAQFDACINDPAGKCNGDFGTCLNKPTDAACTGEREEPWRLHQLRQHELLLEDHLRLSPAAAAARAAAARGGSGAGGH